MTLNKGLPWPGYQAWQLWLVIPSLTLISYLSLVRALRFQRLHRLERRFGYLTRADFARMTPIDASEIQRELVTLEFPFVYLKSLEFALFKTYGFPSMSGLLVSTQELVHPAKAPKRYVDTTVLIREFCMNPPGSERYAEAIARMNFIHSIYQKSGKASNGDMLYTLSLFALEPVQFINRYEWRQLTDMEKCAIGTFWKQIGDDMKISYHELHGNDIGWSDGLEWLESIDVWSTRYEVQGMVPHPNNHTTANTTVDILLWALPQFLQPVGQRAIYALLEDRLRIAMMYEIPPKPYYTITYALLYIRKKFILHCLLPRPSWMPLQYISPKLNEHGRYNLRVYDNTPLYVRPTFWQRVNPQAWLFWMIGKPVPGDGDNLQPEGYKINEVGPKHMVKLGQDATESTKQELLKKDFGRCPFGI